MLDKNERIKNMLLDRNNTKIRLTCQQYECTEFKFSDNDSSLILEFRSKMKTEDVLCTYCGNDSVEVHYNNTAFLKDLPLWVGVKQFVSVWYHRYKCKKCQRVFSEDIVFKDPDARVTERAATAVRTLLSLGLSISSVSKYTGIHWDTIQRLHSTVMKDALETRSESLKRQGYKPTYLAIDEFAIHKGQVYATCVMDLELGDVLWVGKGRSAEDLQKFFQDYDMEYLSNVKAVAMDMNASFNRVVERYLPEADIVYDRYHIQAQYGKEVLGAVRIKEAKRHGMKVQDLRETLSYTKDREDRKDLKQYQREEKQRKKELNAIRWALLTNRKNLTEPQKKSLREILEDHRNLATCYAMKEEMNRLFELRDEEEANKGWQKWFIAARESEIKPLVTFAKNKEKLKDGIISHAVHPISTGKLEGLNNKIKVAKRVGYGYRNDDYFFTLVRYISLPSKYILIPRKS